MVLGLGFHLFRVFSSFPHYFIFFIPFWIFFAFLEEFWIFFGGKEGFMAFWRHFKPFGGFLDGFMGFDGNMVGKWTNEPCNGVDEVVNLFWVLTDCPLMCEGRSSSYGRWTS